MSDEDPTLDVHRDDQTGDYIVGGLSQMHVEVIAERIERRFGVAMDLAPPHVPYRETITRLGRGRGQAQEAERRPRPVRRLLDPGGAAAARRRLRVRGQDRGRGHPAPVHPRGGEGGRRGDAGRRARGPPGGRRAGDALRRQAPRRRLVGDGVQDRRLAGDEGGRRQGGPGAARAGDAGRGDRAVRARRRRDGRPQLPPWAPARHGDPRWRRGRSAPRCRWPRCSATRPTCGR